MNFLRTLTTTTLLALSLVTAINLIEDPYAQFGTSVWFGINHAKSDRTSRTSIISALRNATTPIVLLGTSRTELGFNAEHHPEVFNGGFSGAFQQDMWPLLKIAATNASTPRVISVETINVVKHLNSDLAQPLSSLRVLFSSETLSESYKTFMSSITQALSEQPMGVGKHSARERNNNIKRARRYSKIDVELVRAKETFVMSPFGKRWIRQYVLEFSQSCKNSETTIIFYEPPHRQEALNNHIIRRAISDRTAAWRNAVKNANDFSQGCNLAYLDLSSPKGDWDAAAPQEPWQSNHWLDANHFDHDVGEILLHRFMEFNHHNTRCSTLNELKTRPRLP